MTDTAVPPLAYVILTSKPGQYRTEFAGELEAEQTWIYTYCGRHVATFVIAALRGDARIRVIDEADPAAVSDMPARLLEKFASRDAAFGALQILAGIRNPDAELRQYTPASGTSATQVSA
ncbi:MAG TPA: hypothetical protein VGG24_10390 [Paraburkholderia sp.]|jgi:hypothetical protein